MIIDMIILIFMGNDVDSIDIINTTLIKQQIKRYTNKDETKRKTESTIATLWLTFDLCNALGFNFFFSDIPSVPQVRRC